jgi:hypothetical protein
MRKLNLDGWDPTNSASFINFTPSGALVRSYEII